MDHDLSSDHGAKLRSAWEGLLYGVAAGVVFAAAQALVSASTGQSALAPIRRIATIVTGQDTFSATNQSLLLAGVIIHVAISAGYGLVFGLLAARLRATTRESWAELVLLGAVYGTLVWVLDLQLLARVVFPWLRAGDHGVQLFLHVVAFGAPLGLMYALSERALHRHRARQAQHPAT